MNLVVEVKGGPAWLKVWVDGKVAVDVNKADGFIAATPWTSMGFGYVHYQTLTADTNVYIDEFAVDGVKIACPK